MKEELMKKLENYQRLDAACDLALMLLVICGIIVCGNMEQGRITVPTCLIPVSYTHLTLPTNSLV